MLFWVGVMELEFFRVGVKLIDARVLNVSSRSVAFLREIFGRNEGAHSNFDPLPHAGEG